MRFRKNRVRGAGGCRAKNFLTKALDDFAADGTVWVRFAVTMPVASGVAPVPGERPDRPCGRRIMTKKSAGPSRCVVLIDTNPPHVPCAWPNMLRDGGQMSRRQPAGSGGHVEPGRPGRRYPHSCRSRRQSLFDALKLLRAFQDDRNPHARFRSSWSATSRKTP